MGHLGQCDIMPSQAPASISSPEFVALGPVVGVPPEGAVLVVVLGGVEVRVEPVALHLPEEVQPLTTRPRTVVKDLQRTNSLFLMVMCKYVS